MSRRTKREMAAPPPPPMSLPQPPTLQSGSVPAHWVPDAASLHSGDGVQPTGGQPAWCPVPLPQGTSSSITPPNCGMDYYPPGGFMSYFQTGQQPLVPPFGSFPAPWPHVGKEQIQLPPPSTGSGTKNAKARSKGKTIINIDDGNDVRTAKRLVFEPDEDLRLVSAWLFHSNDPINGNCKKNDSYWGDVHELYNSTTPPNRRREIKHLKDRWQKIKRWVGFFCGSWKKATSIYSSGQSDDQLRDMALQFYLDDYPKEGPFTVLHCWKVLRDEPKWLAVLEDLEKPNKRSLDDGDKITDISDVPERGEKERPIGTKKAKKQRSGKGRAEEEDAMFRRRFWMRRDVFLRIVRGLGRWSPYFTQRVDCTKRLGLSPLQKCTAAIRMLAYGTAADMLDEYLKVAESTGLECLENFVEGVIHVFGNEYLRRPTAADMERLLQVGESRGFPGMLGSIDCMHWRWKNCPTAWKGQFTTGRYGFPTLILEAVASHDLHIWHAFFGVAGSNNDINVLNQSPLFLEVIKGEAPGVQFSVNGTQYNTGYYLADGIYPEWASFVKSINSPQLQKHKVYAREQEGARKDVERAFGVLQSRFNIVRRPARSWSIKILRQIMKACVILHNMIVEDEGEMAKESIDLNVAPGASIVLPPEVEKATNSNPCFNDIRRRNFAIRSHSAHTQLKNDLIEHIYQRFGTRENN